MKHNYEAVVIGTSSGGLAALSAIIPSLPKDFMPVIIIQHMSEDTENYLPIYLQTISKMHVKEAELNEKIVSGTVYISVPGYHILIEPDHTIAFSIDEKVHFARPSIDVLFESAADAYQDKLIGIILTGANADGSTGLKSIKEAGGLTIVQDPTSAEAAYMPQAAIDATTVDYILTLPQIRDFLIGLSEMQKDL
jgi:two-component system chemotaxis response regulator CheB